MDTTMSRNAFIASSVAGLGAIAMATQPCRSHAEEVASGEPDWLGEDPTIAEDQIVDELDTEILIVGAGTAGLMAAAVATEQGADFLLCEKTGAVQETRYWVGGVNTKWHEEAGVEVDGMKLMNEMARYASGCCDQAVWKVWIDESADALAFLDSVLEPYGFTCYLDTEGYDRPAGGTDFYIPPIQHMWHGTDVESMPLAGGMSALQRNTTMEQFLNDNGHDILFGHELVKLEREADGTERVTGAVFSTSEGYVRVNASKGVLLATGGYAGNPIMVNALNPHIPHVTTMATFMPNCTGDGIRAALRIGAVMDELPASMIFDRGIVAPGVDAGYVGEGEQAHFPVSAAAPDAMVVGSLPFMKVNRRGVRFYNESAPYDWCTNAAGMQPGRVWCSVFDSSAAEDALAFAVTGCAKTATTLLQMGPIDTILGAYLEAGTLMKADTLEELAERLGLPEQEFLGQVARYNEMAATGVDDQFGKEAHRLSAIDEPPFYGFWCGGEILTTLDGLRIDADMRVLGADLEPIDGLYAAGDCSGSLYHDNYPEYIVGNAQGRTITFARHAVLDMLKG